MKILIACEFSAIVRDAFINAGHEAISCDILPSERPGPHIIADARVIAYAPRHRYQWDLMIAHPPCTRLANSGVRWLHVPPSGKTKIEIWNDLKSACDFYRALRDAPIKRKAIENPIMHKYAKEIISIGYRQIIQPWWFGEKAFKATGFELINLPPLIPTNKLTPPLSGTDEHKHWSKVHRMSPGPERWKSRSRTYQGVADAMASQWGLI